MTDVTQGDSLNECCPECGQAAPWCWSQDYFGLTCWKCGAHLWEEFVGNTVTRVYHQIHCEKLMKVMPGAAVRLASNLAARQDGYRPCDLCNPSNVYSAGECLRRAGNGSR